MLKLTTNFVANDKQTTALIEDLYGQLDKRKKGVTNWKAAYSVLAGILALRAHGTFRVVKIDLPVEHALVWDAIKDSSLIGHLLQYEGGKGKNEYRVHPKLTTPSSVKDTSLNEFGYRVTGPGGVTFSSYKLIQHPKQVSLLNGRHAAHCTIRSAQTAIQMLYDYNTEQEVQKFPASYESLPPYPGDHPHSLEVVGNIVVQQWLDHLRKKMKRYKYLGVIPDIKGDDLNSIPVVLLADHAHEFNDWAYQVSLDFWRKAHPEGQENRFWAWQGV